MLGVLLTGSALLAGYGEYRGGGYGAVGASLPFDEDRFRSIVAKGIEEARKVLSTTRHPVLPDEVPHAYDDKYRLAELLTSLSDVAVVNVLDELGVGQEARKSARDWAAAGLAVTLRLNVTRLCVLTGIASREVEGEKKREQGPFGTYDTVAVTTKHEATYALTRRFTLSLYPGPVADTRAMEVARGEGRSTLVTPLSEKSERAAKESVPSFDYGGANDTASAEMDLAPLLRRLTPSDELEFRINRTAATTPRRNREVPRRGTRVWHTPLCEMQEALFRRPHAVGGRLSRVCPQAV